MLGISSLFIASAWPLRPENFILIKLVFVKKLSLIKPICLFYHPSQKSTYKNKCIICFFHKGFKKLDFIFKNYLKLTSSNLFFERNLFVNALSSFF